MRLTDISVRALSVPDRGAKIYYDDTLPGFGVRVSEAGTKSYVLTHGPRRMRETIGRVGILSLQEARKAAKERLAEYTLGKQRVRPIRWNNALEEYLVEVAKTCKPSTQAEYRRVLTRDFPFGEMRLTEITAHDLQRDINRRSGAARFHAFTTVRAFLRWAYRSYYLDRNPMERMICPPGSRPRERVLDDHELRAVWNALDEGTFGTIIRLLILTGQRESEIAQLSSEMIGSDKITLPSWLTKNSVEHEFPVGPMVLRYIPDHMGLLFPARGSDRPFSGFSTSKKHLDRACGVSNWWIHDLRRTFRTKWEELGIMPTVAERYINHISGEHSGIRRVYNRYRYTKEMREAALIWEQHLQGIVDEICIARSAEVAAESQSGSRKLVSLSVA